MSEKFKMIKATQLELEVKSAKRTQKSPIAYFEKLSFGQMISWVYRNCQGCESIYIIPRVCVQAKFEDRTEIYTIQKVEVPDYYLKDAVADDEEE